MNAAAEQLELTWLGGAAERRFRQARSSFDDLPWHSLDLGRVPDDDPGLAEARAVWTNGVFTEYASAAAFSALSSAMMQARAPIDLCAVAADFVVDELAHVELVSKLVMALGGAAPYVADLSQISPVVTAERPLLRAAEIAIRVSCVGEALSLPALSASHRGSRHPLAKAVLERLRHDEGPHAAIGHWFMEWAIADLSRGDLEYLSRVATAAVAVYAPLWLEDNHDTVVETHDAKMSYRRYMELAVQQRIERKLARYGITVALPQ